MKNVKRISVWEVVADMSADSSEPPPSLDKMRDHLGAAARPMYNNEPATWQTIDQLLWRDPDRISFIVFDDEPAPTTGNEAIVSLLSDLGETPESAPRLALALGEMDVVALSLLRSIAERQRGLMDQQAATIAGLKESLKEADEHAIKAAEVNAKLRRELCTLHDQLDKEVGVRRAAEIGLERLRTTTPAPPTTTDGMTARDLARRIALGADLLSISKSMGGGCATTSGPVVEIRDGAGIDWRFEIVPIGARKRLTPDSDSQ